MSDIRAALEEAMKAQEAPETTPTPTPEPETAPEPEGRARDESGKFVAKAEKEPPQPIEPAPPPEVEVPQVKAPSGWRKEAQAAYIKAAKGEALAPEEISLLVKEAEKRESDFHNGIKEWKTHSERAKQYEAALAPYKDHLQSLGVDAPTAISALMKADYTLRRSDPATKAAYFQQLAREYGIEFNPNGEVQPVDQTTQYLMQQINDLRGAVSQWQNTYQVEQQKASLQQIERFSVDKPHFDAVREDMAILLEAGKANDLQEAYDMAVWMRPDIRQTLIEAQKVEAQKKAMEQINANRVKAASVAVKGSSPVSGAVQPKTNDLRALLESQFNSIN